jgi:hypothetical protein
MGAGSEWAVHLHPDFAAAASAPALVSSLVTGVRHRPWVPCPGVWRRLDRRVIKPSGVGPAVCRTGLTGM